MEPVPSSLRGERPHLELYPQPCNFNPFPLHPTVCLSLLYSLAGADSVPSQGTYAFTVVQRPPTVSVICSASLWVRVLCVLLLLEEWASLVWVLPLNAAIPCCGRLCIVCCDVHAAVVHAACLPGACWSVVSIFEFVILMNKALVNTYLEIFMWMCILILLLKGMRICGDFTLHRTVNVWFWLLHTFLRSVAACLWTSYRSEHFVFAYDLCWTYFHVLIGFSFVFFSVVPRQMLACFFFLIWVLFPLYFLV